MTKFRKAPVSGLILMELMFCVLFFSLAGAICANLFVSSRMLSRRTQALNTAVYNCSSAMEVLRASDSAEQAREKLSALYPQGSWQGDIFTASIENSVLQLSVTQDEELLQGECSYLTGQGEALYTLHLTHWTEGG